MNDTKLVHFSDITLLYIYTRSKSQITINQQNRQNQRKGIYTKASKSSYPLIQRLAFAEHKAFGLK